jgi:hypothetical protein
MFDRIFTIVASTLALFVSPSSIVVTASSPVIPCSNPTPSSYLVQNLNLTLTPEVPIAGETYTIGVGFDLPESVGTITAGRMGIKVSLSGFPVANEKKDLCGELKCPIEPGSHYYEWIGDVPTGVHGVVTIHEDWTTDTGKTILCLETKYSL